MEGKELRNLIRGAGLSQSDAANKIGVKAAAAHNVATERTTLKHYAKGEQSREAELIKKMDKGLGE